MIFIEIILAWVAWRRGWRWWAVAPIGVTAFFGLLLAVALQSTGGTLEGALPAVALGELACVGALVVMAVKPPKAGSVVSLPSPSGSSA
jgi:hypothetical protein